MAIVKGASFQAMVGYAKINQLKILGLVRHHGRGLYTGAWYVRGSQALFAKVVHNREIVPMEVADLRDVLSGVKRPGTFYEDGRSIVHEDIEGLVSMKRQFFPAPMLATKASGYFDQMFINEGLYPPRV